MAGAGQTIRYMTGWRRNNSEERVEAFLTNAREADEQGRKRKL
jgi:hypothetical protein